MAGYEGREGVEHNTSSVDWAMSVYTEESQQSHGQYTHDDTQELAAYTCWGGH